MKALFSVLTVLFLTACGSAVTTPSTTSDIRDYDLAGLTFSRTFTGTPLGSPQPVEFTHVISFLDETRVTDNGSSFFGNPPESGEYRVENDVVTLKLRGVTGRTYEQRYVLSPDGNTLTGEAGAVLTRER